LAPSFHRIRTAHDQAQRLELDATREGAVHDEVRAR